MLSTVIAQTDSSSDGGGLWAVFLGYTCLLGWHLYLLASLADAE